jgi:hypothetical protein
MNCRGAFQEGAPSPEFAKRLWKITDTLRKDRRDYKRHIGAEEVDRCAEASDCKGQNPASVKARIIAGRSAEVAWTRIPSGYLVAIATMDHKGGNGTEFLYDLVEEPTGWHERRSLVALRRSLLLEETRWVNYNLIEEGLPGFRTYRIENVVEGKFLMCPDSTKTVFEYWAHWSGCTGKRLAHEMLRRAGDTGTISHRMLASVKTDRSFDSPVWITCANGCCEMGPN